jgi:hypothetical protein
MVIVLSLLTAFLRAVSAVIQRRATGKPEIDQLFRRSFIHSLFKNKQWLWGLFIQLAAVLTNGLALYSGSLVLVEALLTTDIVFLLLVLHFYYKVPTGVREWGGVLAISAGLSAALFAAKPHGGEFVDIGITWTITGSIIAVIIIVCAFIMRSSPSEKLRAAMGGVASGCNFALTAGLAKLVFFQAQADFDSVFTSWELYALIVSVLTSIVVLQSTYGAGPLAISQPAVEIVRPLVSATIGVIVLNEIVDINPLEIVIVGIGIVTASIGVFLLADSEPILNSPA